VKGWRWDGPRNWGVELLELNKKTRIDLVTKKLIITKQRWIAQKFKIQNNTTSTS